MIGDDLKDQPILQDPILAYIGITIQSFPNFSFPKETDELMASLDRPSHWYPKKFQYHKFHLFNPFFKRWRRIFYMDCGITVFQPIQPLLDCWKENTVLAHSDTYPYYEWKLHNQFVSLSPYIEELKQTYDLTVDYPQTTILLYDTNVIEDTTEQDLYNLMLRFPNSVTNDQGIMALYFTNVRKLWKQIPIGNDTINFYDYMDRHNGKPYIMLKSC